MHIVHVLLLLPQLFMLSTRINKAEGGYWLAAEFGHCVDQTLVNLMGLPNGELMLGGIRTYEHSCCRFPSCCRFAAAVLCVLPLQ